MKVQIFTDFSTPGGTIQINDLVDQIRCGEHADTIKAIQSAAQNNDRDKADELKKSLPAVCFTASFNGRRRNSNLSHYNQLIVLDIDKIADTEISDMTGRIEDIDYTMIAFRSPSGKGIKVVVKVSTDVDDHKFTYSKVVHYYERMAQCQVDTSGSDISRMCFLSFDPQCYYQPNSAIFDPFYESDKSVYDLDYQDAKTIVAERLTYQEGNRNNFVFQLACECFRRNIPFQHTADLITGEYDLPTEEIRRTLKSAFERIGTEDKINVPQNMSTPCLPDEIFEHLPSILSMPSSFFEDKRERDIFLITSITLFSGAIRNVSGLYDGFKVFANLYFFVVAPPASGKGSMKFAQKLLMKHHEKLLKESRMALTKYEMDLAEHQKAVQDGSANSSDCPNKPPFLLFFLPANSSYASLLKLMISNDGNMVICETEATTLSSILSQKWAAFKDLLLKAFHHEIVSVSRAKENQFDEIECPKGTIVLTGTPEQVVDLIQGTEDGLYSRFLFYRFNRKPEWRQIMPTYGGFNATEYLDVLGQEVSDFIDQLWPSGSINYKLTDHQWQKLNDFGKKQMRLIAGLEQDKLAATVKRFGLILFRMSMVLSTLRCKDSRSMPSTLTCLDKDFETSLKIVECLIDHNKVVFSELPTKHTEGLVPYKQKFFDGLAQRFKRNAAIELAQNQSIAKRTADQWLKEFVKANLISRVGNGFYRKEVGHG